MRVETVRMDSMEVVTWREMDAQERERSRQGELWDYADKSFDRHTEREQQTQSEQAALQWGGQGPANPALTPEAREKIEAEARERATVPDTDATPGKPPTH